LETVPPQADQELVGRNAHLGEVGEVNTSRMRLNCSSRGNSSHAAISSSVGVAEGMTVLMVGTSAMNAIYHAGPGAEAS
jgi:hypothetical protein